MPTKPTPETVEKEIYDKLSSKWWRMTSGSIYQIKDKSGKGVPFIPNEFQLYYLKNKHNRNIILKARQMGFSTVVQLDYLDDALFNNNMNVGIIAQDIATAATIRKDKIEFALDNLPEDIKGIWKYDKSNAREIGLSNGSSIYISNTFRGGTLQRLHVSEYAKICAQRPEKAKEIQTGALEAVAMDQQITIESTAEGNEGNFYDKCETYKVLMGKPLTPLDFKFFFFPWWLDSTYSYEGIGVFRSQEVDDYLKKLDKEHGIKLSDGQKNWYYLKKKEKKEKIFKEYPSIYKEAFQLATEGAYYESEINIAYQQGRVSKVPYDPNILVYTSRDIGGSNPDGGGDSTAVWFRQMYQNEIRAIDFREGSGYSLLYILEHIIKTKPYLYAKHIGPHDMNVHEYTTGTTRLQTARQLGFDFELVTSPKGAISNRIEAMRQIFSRIWFDEQKCGDGLTMLKKYRRVWDEKNGCFKDIPLHNGVSHCNDSAGYRAQYVSEYFSKRGAPKESSVMKMNWKL